MRSLDRTMAMGPGTLEDLIAVGRDMVEGETPNFRIAIEPAQMAGVWANYAQVSHSIYEFTLDFVRLDFAQQTGIVVARVSVSPLFITQLIDALQENWRKYAEKALPTEVTHGDNED